MCRYVWFPAFLTLAIVLSAFMLETRPAVAAVPAGFDDRLVTSVQSPTSMAFTPDGRMLITTQPGLLRVRKSGSTSTTQALDIRSKVCSNSERGLLGVAVDPNFSSNHYVYLYYTFEKFGVCPTGQPTNKNNPVNRVSRFTMSGDTVSRASEKLLIDNIPSPNGNHNGGDVHFGKDGYLYISVGDGGRDYNNDSGGGGENDASRDRNVLLGKVLRVTRDGGIPATNPYTDTDSARCGIPSANGRTTAGKNCQETFASGLRNPFRMGFDPTAAGTSFFINDVGQNAWEEIDRGKAGADYAWNLCEGSHDNPDRPGSVNCGSAPYTPPVHEYSHSNTGCESVTGGAFVPNGVWPAEYEGSYLFGDYVCNKIFELEPKSGGGFTRTEFATGLGQGGPIAMAFGPYGSSQALYYTTYANGGEIRRIAQTGDVNRPPSASLAANPTSGSLPLVVDFDGSGSGDPDASDTLTYLWDFGDGSVTETTSLTASHTYSTDGTYIATLRVRDNHGAVSDPATVRIDAGNEAPTPLIESPSAVLLFGVGQEITLSGSATDPEDGPLLEDSFEWEVIRHHDGNHTHPFLSGTGNGLTFIAPPPEDLSSTGTGNYLEIRFTATDSGGLSKTVTQKLQPNRVNVSLESNPSALSLQVNGETFAAPRTLVSWEGYKLNVNAPSPQVLSGTTHVFSSWSNGKGQQHSIVTGAAPSTYTATFKACTITGTSGDDDLDGTSSADVICGMSGNDTIRGMGGDDTIEGMGGNDSLRGDGGADKIRGSTGADSLYGGDGDDTLNSQDGVSGNDSLDGGPGTDIKTTDATEKVIVGFP